MFIHLTTENVTNIVLKYNVVYSCECREKFRFFIYILYVSIYSIYKQIETFPCGCEVKCHAEQCDVEEYDVVKWDKKYYIVESEDFEWDVEAIGVDESDVIYCEVIECHLGEGNRKWRRRLWTIKIDVGEW